MNFRHQHAEQGRGYYTGNEATPTIVYKKLSETRVTPWKTSGEIQVHVSSEPWISVPGLRPPPWLEFIPMMGTSIAFRISRSFGYFLHGAWGQKEGTRQPRFNRSLSNAL